VQDFFALPTFSKGAKKSGVDRLSPGLEALANLLKERGAGIFIGPGGSCRFPASHAGSPAVASLNVPFPAGSFGDLRQNLQAHRKEVVINTAKVGKFFLLIDRNAINYKLI
jgi:hypothetical protein